MEIQVEQKLNADPYKSLMKLYKDLMEQGYTMNDIDEMDIHGFFEVYKQDENSRRMSADELDAIIPD